MADVFDDHIHTMADVLDDHMHTMADVLDDHKNFCFVNISPSS